MKIKYIGNYLTDQGRSQQHFELLTQITSPTSEGHRSEENKGICFWRLQNFGLS